MREETEEDDRHPDKMHHMHWFLSGLRKWLVEGINSFQACIYHGYENVAVGEKSTPVD
jgi:hypothetical protein